MTEKIIHLLVAQSGGHEATADIITRAAWLEAQVEKHPRRYGLQSDIVNKLIKAAEQHGIDTCEPDHLVGDLQQALQEAWRLMTVPQRLAWRHSDALEAVLNILKD